MSLRLQLSEDLGPAQSIAPARLAPGPVTGAPVSVAPPGNDWELTQDFLFSQIEGEVAEDQIGTGALNGTRAFQHHFSSSIAPA